MRQLQQQELSHKYEGLGELNEKLSELGIKLRDSSLDSCSFPSGRESNKKNTKEKEKEKEKMELMKRYGMIGLCVGSLGVFSM